MEPNVKEYAGGWITEKKGTVIPGLLKISFIIIALGCIAYMLLYMNGEVAHATRGMLVQRFNAVTGSSNGLMYGVAAAMVIYGAIVARFVFSKRNGE